MTSRALNSKWTAAICALFVLLGTACQDACASAATTAPHKQVHVAKGPPALLPEAAVTTGDPSANSLLPTADDNMASNTL